MRQFTISKLLIAFLMMLCCGTAMATGYVYKGGFKYFVDTDKGEATFVDANHKDNSKVNQKVIVADNVTLNGVKYPVTSIGSNSFGKYVRRVEIPNSVTTLERNSFRESSIDSLVIPSSVISVGSGSFSNCKSLVHIVLSNNITEIPTGCFMWCNSLKKIIVPGSVQRIDEQAFSNCTKLTDVSISEGVTYIGPCAFAFCEALKTISLPSTMASLGSEVFDRCYQLKIIWCWAVVPPSIFSDTFFSLQSSHLYVPKISVGKYKTADEWKLFGEISDIETTNIGMVTTSSEVFEISRYSANGQLVVVPTKGLNIVKYSNGSVRKEIVK